ncbi:MAG: hypothetical protein JO180_01400 [Gemmatirosa sp.]|nr:hypothetical protein [Gemmatirosa sp.]
MPSTVAHSPSAASAARGLDAILVPATAPPHLRAMRRWLGGVLSVYAAALRVGATLGEGALQWPIHDSIGWRTPGGVLAAALLAAVPPGYFIAFALRGRAAVPLAMFVALAVECCVQGIAALAGRPAWPVCLAAAVSGAAIGAVGFLAVAARLRGRATSDATLVAPDLPLVGGAYLAAPLLWLAADAEARSGPGRGAWSVLLLGLFGTSLLASARASRGPAGGGVLTHAAAAIAWFVIGASPLFAASPARAWQLTGMIACFGAAYPMLLGSRGRERRVEGPALRRAAPFLAIYTGLGALAPLAAARAGTAGAWIGWVAIDAAAAPAGWSEPIALFALCGYVIAELRGRREDSPGATWRGMARWIVPAAVVVGALRVAGRMSEPARTAPAALALTLGCSVVALVLSARLGAALYALQRGHARAHASRFGVRELAVAPRGREAVASRRGGWPGRWTPTAAHRIEPT